MTLKLEKNQVCRTLFRSPHKNQSHPLDNSYNSTVVKTIENYQLTTERKKYKKFVEKKIIIGIQYLLCHFLPCSDQQKHELLRQSAHCHSS